MQSIHRLEAVGNIVESPQQRFTPNGTAATRVRVAVNDYLFTSNDDEGKPQFKKVATFYSIELYDKAATAICAKNLEKGDIVYFEGRPQVDQFTRQDGTVGLDHKIKNGQVRVIHQKKASEGYKEAPGQEDMLSEDIPVSDKADTSELF